MSLDLSSTIPSGWSVYMAKPGKVTLSNGAEELEIPLSEFCQIVMHVMTNTDIGGAQTDPRTALKIKMLSLKLVRGHNGINSRRYVL